MAITPPPTPPNTGNPAQLEERADAFFGWFPSFVTDFNNDLALLRGKTWAARTGSANAIILTAGVTVLTTGTQVRFRAGSANTGATTINLDGSGAIACRTIAGFALPAGYIRTDTETVATYDGAFWVVDRQAERGFNSNGFYTRFAEGTQLCYMAKTLTGELGGSAAMRASVAFPAVFSSLPSVAGVIRIDTASGYASTTGERDRLGGTGVVNLTAEGCFFDVYRSFGAPNISGAASVVADIQAIGRWY